MFKKQRVHFEPPAPICCMVAANSTIVLGLANKKVIRRSLGDDSLQDEIQLSHDAKQLFLDPTGSHLLIGSQHGDMSYIHARSRQARTCSKLGGHILTAVGWNHELGTVLDSSFVLLGNSAGQLLETHLVYDAKSKSSNMHYTRVLFTLSGVVSSVCLNRIHDRWLILVATPGALHPFAGSCLEPESSGALVPVFSRYDSQMPRSHALPGAGEVSQVCVFGEDPPTRYAWLVCHSVKAGAIDPSLDDPYAMTSGEQRIVKVANAKQLVLLEYHAIVLTTDGKLKCVCIVDEREYYEDDVTAAKCGTPLSVCRDAVSGTVWVCTERAVFKYRPAVEPLEGHVWKVLLEKGLFVEARRACSTQSQTETVLATEAELLFNEGKLNAAAELWAISNAPIDDVALRYLNLPQSKQLKSRAGDNDTVDEDARGSLKKYLTKRLEHMHIHPKISDDNQKTLLIIWLIEIFLTELGEARSGRTRNTKLSDVSVSPNLPLPHITARPISVDRTFDEHSYKALKDEFRCFLSREGTLSVVRSHEHAIRQLMSAHGDMDGLTQLALLLQQTGSVVELCIQQELYDDALRHLRTGQSVDRDLWYRYSPDLIAHVPEKLISAWIAQGDVLAPIALLPTILRASKDGRVAEESIRFIEHSIRRLACTDRAVHNALVSLYVKDAKYEDALLSYFRQQDDAVISLSQASVLYDPGFALRSCLQYGRTRAVVHLYIVLNLLEEAVSAALKIPDLSLAKSVCIKLRSSAAFNSVVSDHTNDLLHRAWLSIAKHSITSSETETDMETCIALLHESDDVLKIQDLLPFFPDFVTVEHFKEPLCACLAEQSGKIKELQGDIADATSASEDLKKRLQADTARYTIVKVNARCMQCSLPALSGRTAVASRCVVFPCRHYYHEDCLSAAAQSHCRDKQHVRSDECPLCGSDALASLIDVPFYTQNEYMRELSEWNT